MLQPLNLIPPKKAVASEEEEAIVCKSARLLVDQGFVRPVHHGPGLFHYLPLAARSMRKLEAIIDEAMGEIEAQKMAMPALTPALLWEDSGR
jgi:prolyl-tRNA synthetase